MADRVSPVADLERATHAADAILGGLVAWLDDRAEYLHALDRTIADHPAAYRDDVATGNVWPDDDDEPAIFQPGDYGW